MPKFENGVYVCNVKKGNNRDQRVPYLRVSAGPQRHMYVHQLVAMAKIGRTFGDNETVDHVDGNTLNNLPENLEVVTREENTRRAMFRHHHQRKNCA